MLDSPGIKHSSEGGRTGATPAMASRIMRDNKELIYGLSNNLFLLHGINFHFHVMAIAGQGQNAQPRSAGRLTNVRSAIW
jgi:hypothetical protein